MDNQSALCAIIAVIALLAGRQLVQLWKPAAGESEVVSTAGESLRYFDDVSAPVDIEFGNVPFVMHRQALVGSQDAAMIAMCDTCSAQLERCDMPAQPMNPSEEKLLDLLASRRPLRKPNGVTTLYRLDKSIPVVVGTRSDEGNHGEADRRVVVWGMMVPRSEGSWTIYSFRSKNSANGREEEVAGPVSIPAPPDTKHLMSIRSSHTGIGAFAGSSPEAWADFYNEWFRRHGWAVVRDWYRSESQWHASFETRRGTESEIVELHFRMDSRNTEAAQAWQAVIAQSTSDPAADEELTPHEE